MTSSFRPGIVHVTAGSEAEAERIAEALVAERLAACVQLIPIRSIYRWKGDIHREGEWQLVAKCDLRRFTDLERRVRELHSYEVPEILACPVHSGSSPYLAWLETEANPD